MTIVYEERLSDSPYVESITHGYTASDGSAMRPAEMCWHMVFTRYGGRIHPLIVGPLTEAGVVSWGEGAEILWIKFKLGTYMPRLPTRACLDLETLLPEASSQSFWLNGSAWQFPDFENADTFVNRLARDGSLDYDPIVSVALHRHPQEVSSRTVRHRFLRATGLTQSRVFQFERAQKAAALLRQSVSIPDTIYEAGYFDQPHLTRSLKRWIGHTPAQIIRMSQPDCHSVQDNVPAAGYDASVLAVAR